MNVFQFLGLPELHRAKNKAVQLVKHIAEVPVSKIKFPLYAQTKKDGVFAMIVSYQGRLAIFGRTGKALTNVEAILERWGYLPDGVYIGELCIDECSLETLSGIVNPNRTKALDEEQDMLAHKMYIAFHDHLFINEFVQGESDREYMVRHRSAEYRVGKFHTLPVTTLNSMEDCEAYAANRIGWGEEGAVFKQMGTGYEAGHKGWRAMKIVRGVDYDLLCLDFEEGTGKYAGKAANLIFQWKDGQTLKVMLGKGWTHQDAMDIWHGERKVIGGIFKIHALQESSKGKLRLPKVLEQRIDKELPDV